jgi:hypothetical protein
MKRVLIALGVSGDGHAPPTRALGAASSVRKRRSSCPFLPPSRPAPQNFCDNFVVGFTPGSRSRPGPTSTAARCTACSRCRARHRLARGDAGRDTGPRTAGRAPVEWRASSLRLEGAAALRGEASVAAERRPRAATGTAPAARCVCRRSYRVSPSAASVLLPQGVRQITSRSPMRAVIDPLLPRSRQRPCCARWCARRRPRLIWEIDGRAIAGRRPVQHRLADQQGRASARRRDRSAEQRANPYRSEWRVR